MKQETHGFSSLLSYEHMTYNPGSSVDYFKWNREAIVINHLQ